MLLQRMLDILAQCERVGSAGQLMSVSGPPHGRPLLLKQVPG